MLAALVILVLGIPHDVSFGQALHLAGATGRLKAVDFRFDLRETYTFWSGMIGGLFLMLAYFGCDQSQVQRYLTAKSVDEARSSLMMSAFVKIPLPIIDDSNLDQYLAMARDFPADGYIYSPYDQKLFDQLLSQK